MTRLLSNGQKALPKDVSEILEEEFLKVDEKLLQQQNETRDDSGIVSFFA